MKLENMKNSHSNFGQDKFQVRMAGWRIFVFYISFWWTWMTCQVYSATKSFLYFFYYNFPPQDCLGFWQSSYSWAFTAKPRQIFTGLVQPSTYLCWDRPFAYLLGDFPLGQPLKVAITCRALESTPTKKMKIKCLERKAMGWDAIAGSFVITK